MKYFRGKMRSIKRDFIFLILISISNSIILNRAQLKIWYPFYSTISSFDLSNKKITLISNDTFTNLTNLNNQLDLSLNQISFLDPFTFSDLFNLKIIQMQ